MKTFIKALFAAFLVMLFAIDAHAGSLVRLIGVNDDPSSAAPKTWQLIAAYDENTGEVVTLVADGLPDKDLCAWEIYDGFADSHMACNDEPFTELRITPMVDEHGNAVGAEADWSTYDVEAHYQVMVLPYQVAVFGASMRAVSVRAELKPAHGSVRHARRAVEILKRNNR